MQHPAFVDASVLFDDLLQSFAEFLLDFPISTNVLIQLLPQIRDFLLLALDIHLQSEYLFRIAMTIKSRDRHSGVVDVLGLRFDVLLLVRSDHIVLETLHLVQLPAVTPPPALTFAVLLPQPAILHHVLIDLGLQLLYDHLHLRPLDVNLRRFLLRLPAYLVDLLLYHQNGLLTLLLIGDVLPAVFLGRAPLGLLQLESQLLLLLLQLFDLVLEVQDVQMEVIVLVLELLEVWRYLPLLLQVFDLLLFQFALVLQLEVGLL